MLLDVELFGQLAPGLPRRHVLHVERPMTVREVAVRLGVDPDAVGLIVIDGVLAAMDGAVPTSGRLCFFPPVSGG